MFRSNEKQMVVHIMTAFDGSAIMNLDGETYIHNTDAKMP